MGGEAFLVIANGTGLGSAETLAQRVRAEVAEYQFSTVGRVTIGIGVAQFYSDISVSHTFSNSKTLIALLLCRLAISKAIKWCVFLYRPNMPRAITSFMISELPA
jgi:GGDEF domain-containing protein